MASESSSQISLGDDALLGRNLVVRRIFTLHYESLFRFLWGRLGSRDEASDVAQEAYLRLCRQQDLDKLQGKERSYLFKVATNLLKDRHRRRVIRKDSRDRIIEDTVERSTALETPQHRLEYKQTMASIRKALLAMDPKLRQVFLMRRFHQTPYCEIADTLGVSERTVERRMSQALCLLKNELMSQASSSTWKAEA